MQIHENGHSIIDYYFGYLLKQSQKRVLNISVRDNSRDTVVLSGKAKRELKNADIEKQIQSGEPMTGVTYEEYCDYYYDTHGCTYGTGMKQEYRQALKGDNASLRDKEWRWNPNYRIPERLGNAPEVIADREAALEKFRNGEELEPWERRVRYAFPRMADGVKAVNEANIERSRRILERKVTGAISEAGLPEDTELELNVWGYELSVSGNISEDKLAELNDKLSESAFGFQGLYHDYHHDEAVEGGLPLVYAWSAEKYLKENGGGSVYDIGKDKDGNFTGLPGDLSDFIKENAVGKFGFGYGDRKDDRHQALYMRETFNSVIESVKCGSYEKLRGMTCKLTYKDGVLSC